MKNNDSEKRKKKPGRKSAGRIVAILTLIAVACWGAWQFSMMASRYGGEEAVWLKIPSGSTAEAVADSVCGALGEDYGRKVLKYWSGNVGSSRGAYRIEPGEKAIDIARRIDNGRQTPVRLTFNNVRTLQQLADKLSARMDWTASDFIEAFDAVAAKEGVSREVLLGRMMPDTYEVYWTSAPDKVIAKFLDNYDSFWNEERRAQAKSLGLTPDEVAVLASIAEEESAMSDERGKIARLYLNRLHKGMKLQADPTVKYAVGDWTIRRVGGRMLSVDSPYNTYRYAGLPPSAIRIPDRRTLQAVLDAPAHDYIYMCAKSDFSGYHDFTADYSQHQRNAAAFRRALDARGISLDSVAR